MLQQPWFNFGLFIGDGDTPTNDNVVRLTEPLYRAVPERFMRFTTLSTTPDDLPLQYRRRVWKLLGHTGQPPRMRIVIDGRAVEEAVKRVTEAEKNRPPSLAEQVQAKLDSYTTDEQRRQRLDALEAIREGTTMIDIAIEIGVLRARLNLNRIITAEQLSNTFRESAEAGRLPLYVTIDGKRRKVPLKVIRRGM